MRMKEIRIHGRGGQGVVLASEIVVNAMIKEGKYAACFPFFGFERRGAPVFGFVRFDESPIRQKDQVYDPDCVVVFDETLFKAVDVYQGVKEGGTLVVNARGDVKDLSLPPQIGTVGIVDATTISIDAIRTFIPNAAMLGAFCKTTAWVGPDSLKKSLNEMLAKKNRKKSIEMFERAYHETRVFEVAPKRTGE